MPTERQRAAPAKTTGEDQLFFIERRTQAPPTSTPTSKGCGPKWEADPKKRTVIRTCTEWLWAKQGAGLFKEGDRDSDGDATDSSTHKEDTNNTIEAEEDHHIQKRTACNGDKNKIMRRSEEEEVKKALPTLRREQWKRLWFQIRPSSKTPSPEKAMLHFSSTSGLVDTAVASALSTRKGALRCAAIASQLSSAVSCGVGTTLSHVDFP